ncbi:MAG: hypothetical protein IT370_19665 [Deltaproteobacteria bacterium]|nr:hypothetical protein [Deltaproteobacteria bacterium]
MTPLARIGLLLGGLGLMTLAGCGDDDAGGGGDAGDPAVDGSMQPRPDGGPPATGVRVHLERNGAATTTLAAFGVPVPPGALASMAEVRLSVGGNAIAGATATQTLAEHGPTGAPTGVRAFVVQLPISALAGGAIDIDIGFDGGAGSAPAATRQPYTMASVAGPENVDTAVRSIRAAGGGHELYEMSTATRTLFTGREPAALASFPAGYLAETGILGAQRTAADVAAQPRLAGMKFLSDALLPFARSAMYRDGYRVNPDAVVDPVVEYEGWLYDRCATFLTVHVHTGDAEAYRHALRSCSYYASKINLTGADAGIFSGKPDPDTKYSHLRGLYAYYALTGDDSALAAGTAIANLWLNDATFAVPYAQGRLRGIDRLWTERLLGTAFEGLYYGHRLTGETRYLTAFQAMLTTAHTHITTTDQAALMTMTGNAFPPQNCFIHNAAQHAEGDTTEPWCSGWMSELTLDALLAYQAQTDDPRVDEIFIRLARFLRDVGSSYFTSDILPDSFLAPSACYRASDGDNARRLVPLYGAGLAVGGARMTYGDYSDYEHCTDATALTAAALRGLRRQGKFDAGPAIGPFATEGASLLALHHELSACAQRTFAEWTRLKRAPSSWTSAELAAGAANPAAFITANKIGWPVRPSTPQRKLSWWFNMSMLDFALLDEAAADVTSLNPGRVQPAGMTCN